MSHRDTPHFLKTLDTLWRHTEGPGVFAGDPKGSEPGGIWTLLTSIQQPPMRQIHVYLFASQITTPFGTICPQSEILSPPLPSHCTLFIPVTLKPSSFALF